MRIIRELLALVCFALTVWAQDTAVRLEFEVASVKPHASSGGTNGSPEVTGIAETTGQVRLENLNLRALIGIAYGVRSTQVTGPDWLDRTQFDIVAKPPSGYQHQQLQHLLRNLLANRFKLAVHQETKEGQAFALVVAKGGFKPLESARPRSYLTGRPGLIAGDRRSISELANVLASLLKSPVADRTGLGGMYDLKLEWTPDEAPGRVPVDLEEESKEISHLDGPSLFAALRDQLGLRLASEKAPMEIVVVDHAERVPTEN